MIDVRILLVQLSRQALGLFLRKELRPGSDTSAYGGFPMDRVRFHTIRVLDETVLFGLIHCSQRQARLIRQDSEAGAFQPRSRFNVPPGPATSIIHATHATVAARR